MLTQLISGLQPCILWASGNFGDGACHRRSNDIGVEPRVAPDAPFQTAMKSRSLTGSVDNLDLSSVRHVKFVRFPAIL